MEADCVSIVNCATYDLDEVGSAIAKALELIGIDAAAFEDREVLLKINLLNGSGPEVCANTNVEFTRALIKYLKAAGARPFVSDSSGPISDTDRCFETSGYAKMCSQENVPLMPLSAHGYQEVSVPHGKRIRSVLVSRLLLEADLVISLPKIKTHVQTVYTGAVKNWFGVLPLTERRRFHRLAKYEAFSEALVDLCSVVDRGISLMDAVMGMDGHGPSSGTPAKVGLVLASKRAANLDVVACEVIGLAAHRVHTVKDTIERGLAKPVDQIEVVGVPLREVKCNFHIPSRLFLRANPLAEILTDMFLGLYRSVVVVDKEKCTACGHCLRICPVGAIEIDNYCRIDYSKCIKCYCCFEVCPYDAIALQQSLWGRILRKIKKAKEKH